MLRSPAFKIVHKPTIVFRSVELPGRVREWDPFFFFFSTRTEISFCWTKRRHAYGSSYWSERFAYSSRKQFQAVFRPMVPQHLCRLKTRLTLKNTETHSQNIGLCWKSQERTCFLLKKITYNCNYIFNFSLFL